MKFIAAEDSPNGNPVLAVANEVSKTTTLYDIVIPTTEELINNLNQAPIVTQNNGDTEVELIDLQGLSGKVKVDYIISREADFDNEVYFYKVDDITGNVGGVGVGDARYLQNALDNIISPAFSTNNNNVEFGTVELEAGSLIAPLIIANNTLAEAESGNANVYFAFPGAVGGDGFDHITKLSNRTFGFEDLPNGGDRDFNDITITIDSFSV